jgi:hypothetical protein
MTKRSVTKKPKLTQWFDGSVKPVRDGVYLRYYGSTHDCYSLFKKGVWHLWSETPEKAAKAKGKAHFQLQKWRGLAQNPEVKP